MKSIMLFFLMVTIISCRMRDNLPPTNQATTVVKIDSSKGQSDTFFVKDKSIIFCYPDSNTATVIEKKLGETRFSKVVEDNDYYDSQAIDFLESRSNKPLFTDKKVIKVGNESGTYVFNKDSIANSWFVILFNGIDTPIIVSSMDLPDEYVKIWK